MIAVHEIPLTLDGTVSIMIPPRTEVTTYVNTKLVNTCVVLNQEIIPHVFIANSIGQPVNGMIPVRVVNFKNKPVTIQIPNIKIENLQNYNIVDNITLPKYSR